MDFKPYHNNWLDVDPLFIPYNTYVRSVDYLPVNLDIDFFKNLKFSKEDYIKIRINAAHKAARSMGSNPALCISGGVDSQVMLQSWLEADLPFTACTLVFKNDLNDMDVQHARKVCQEYGIRLEEFEIDIIQFLNYFNFDYATKYESCSPHFNTHYKLFDILKLQGFTGVCCGGDAPSKNNSHSSWGTNFTRNTNTFIKYIEVNKYPCIGNFISYDPKLAWTIALNTKSLDISFLGGGQGASTKIVTLDENQQMLSVYDTHFKTGLNQRYVNKCEGYEKLGYKLIVQDQKYTGFEKVKKYLETKTGDGWEFEKRYRAPLEKIFNYANSDPIFMFKDGVENYINELHNDLCN